MEEQEQDVTQADRTYFEQLSVQKMIEKIFEKFQNFQKQNPDMELEEFIGFSSEEYADDIIQKFLNVGINVRYLDPGQPWIMYWNLHSLDILNIKDYQIDSFPLYQKKIIEYLNKCQHKDGGYGGGPYQIPHLAPTYGAIMTLLVIGTEAAYKSINRQKLHPVIKGAFIMHELGEIDLRACYLVIVVAKVLGILTPELIEGTADYIASCQTYEGGLGGETFCEAHGGYAFCGLAALCALNLTNKLDINKFVQWLVNRQMSVEGGFNGRTNKVVDACYTFWQGAMFKLLDYAYPGQYLLQNNYLMDCFALEKYIFLCCQDKKRGGFRDKPGKPSDYYHTCYTLAGLSVSTEQAEDQHLLENLQFKKIDPILNIISEKAIKASKYFSSL